MKYFIFKTFYNLKNKKVKIILLLLLEFILMYTIGIMYKTSNYDLLNLFYGNVSSIDVNVLLSILKLFILFFQIYLMYYLLIQDLVVSKINIFTRIDERNWFLKKTFVLSIFLVLFKIGHFIVIECLYSIITGKFGFSLSLFSKDFLFSYSLFLSLFSLILHKKKFLSILFILFFLLLLYSYYTNGYLLNNMFLFIIDIILWFYNLFRINLKQNFFESV